MKKITMKGISKLTALAVVSVAASAVFFCTMDLSSSISSLLASLVSQFTLSFAASVAASAVFVRTMAKDLLPAQFEDYLSSLLNSFLGRLSSELTIFVDEFNGPIANPIYKSVETYLSTKLPHSTRRLHVTKSEESDRIQVSMHKGEEVVEVFNNIHFAWRFTSRTTDPKTQARYHPRQLYSIGSYTVSETKAFELTFHKKHKDVAIDSYLPYVIESSELIKQESKNLVLCTNDPDTEEWTPVNMTHPVTFDKLAMEEGLKREVMEDLKRFVKRKEYYRKVGKAWKRGYLLHGPPGTGKSSLVAAMANYLRFDVYDLQLTEVKNNSELRSLLLGMGKRSILVIEDIDCSADFIMREQDDARKKKITSGNTEDKKNRKVTLSGLLNSVDGLWSSCADERIIVFTTNYKDKLDPALLRPGRMDMHIHMSYCTPSGFRVLASNYHSLDDHPLFEEIEGLIREIEVTPAVVAEELMKNEDAELALRGLIRFLEGKRRQKNN